MFFISVLSGYTLGVLKALLGGGSSMLKDFHRGKAALECLHMDFLGRILKKKKKGKMKKFRGT